MALFADGQTTRFGLHEFKGSREADPIARVFVDRGWPGQIVGGLLFLAADVGLRYLLHRKGHHDWERSLPAILVGYGAINAINNAVNFKHAL